jgi:nucleotide-binding universal stress UspA family protein
MADESKPEEAAPLHNPPDEPKALLVAVDASSNAPRVISMAVRLSRAMPEAAVHVVHVFRTSRLDRPRLGTPTGNADLVEEAKEHLAYHVRTLKKSCRAPVTGHLEMGDPAGEVLRLAGSLDVDLLIVGTHDYVGFERFLLGSVAETLMRKAGCPVLVVRPKSHAH